MTNRIRVSASGISPNCNTAQRRIELRRTKKSLPKRNELAKMIAPRLATMAMNLIVVGPRIILRGAFQLFRANIWTRILSTLVLVSIDIYYFVKKKISAKQIIINLILSVALLTGGTTGWMLGRNSVLAIAAENVVILFIAGLAGAGVLSKLLDSICRKVMGRFLKSDVEEMLNFINAEFELMVKERELSDQQADELAKRIEISNDVCVNCFSKADKKKYVRNILQPYFTESIGNPNDCECAS